MNTSFPHIFTDVMSYLFRNYRIISSVDYLQSSIVNIGYIYIHIYIWESRNNVVFCFSHKTSLKLKFRLPSDRSFFFCFLKIQSRRKISKYSFYVTVLFFGPFLAHFRFDSQFQLREQLKKYFFLCKFGINHLSKKIYKVKTMGK